MCWSCTFWSLLCCYFSPFSLLAASPAHAAGDDVLYYTGHSGFSVSQYFPPTDLQDVIENEECGAFVETDVWPDDLSPYRIVVLMIPSQVWSASEITQLRDFLDDDGVLVATGDTRNYDSAHITPMNSLLGALGVTSTLDSASIDSGCGNANRATAVGVHPLTLGIGLPGVQYGWSSDITVGSGGTLFLEGGSGQSIGVVEGQVVLFSDINIFVDDCNLTDANRTLYSNLYHLGTSVNSCDMDVDGVLASHCDGQDCNDCDPEVDIPQNWYPDSDSDDFGDLTSVPTASCDAPNGYTADNTDCDDGSGLTYPGASEQCDGLDNNCDSVVPDNESDSDDDGYRVCESDCADNDDTRFPGATELCDGLDNNCDTVVPANENDADDDGYRVCESDCDDTLSSIFPGADVECIGVDWGCDGTISPSEMDSDDDGVCDPVDQCPDADDALDADNDGVPDACDVCQGDDHCGDEDEDGFCADSDCNDDVSVVFPGAEELCDGLDNDCDNIVPASENDSDDDGYRVCELDLSLIHI